MRSIFNNRILRTGILGFFVLAVFLAPVSIFIQWSSSEKLVSFGHGVVSAQQEAQDSGLAAKIGNSIMNAVGYSVLEFSAMFTRFGGLFFETALKYTVFEMGKSVQGSLSKTIDTLWSLIRDICNLAFIFGFIYIGIRTIIDPDSATMKRFLSRIIIGALLINFSLFFAKAIIDFSNFTAYQVYNSMVIDSGGSLSATVVDSLRLVTFYNSQTGKTPLEKNNNFSTFVGGSLFLLITAFVFFAGALLLVVRFITLVLIMVASPILFAATVFPQTEHFAKDLWSKLVSQSFFAPVYLLLILISIKITQGVGLSGSANFSKDFFSFENNVSALLNFAIIIFFMISSLIIATKMGIKGGDMAVKFAGGMSFGLAARMGRATVGRLGHNISERGGLKDAAAQKGLRGWAARQALRSGRAVGDSSFDLRNANKDLSRAMNIGEGRKGGYKTVKDEVEKKESEFAKSLGVVDDDDVRVAARKAEMEYAQRNTKAQSAQLRKQLEDPALNQAARLAIQAQIDQLEKDQKKKEIAYEKEKQRRIIGSTYAEPSRNAGLIRQKKNILDDPQLGLKRQLQDAWGNYVTLPEQAKAGARIGIEALLKQISDAEKEYNDLLTSSVDDRGYAGVLEASNSSLLKNKIPTWSSGRLIEHNVEAGEAIRKAAEKGLPKEKT